MTTRNSWTPTGGSSPGCRAVRSPRGQGRRGRLALLEAEPFSLLITDLRMPKIDGFQVLMAARRSFRRRTVAITGLGDQQYRARAYASGIDLYTEKPTTPTEIRLFSECVEALLAQGGHDGGFRGIQSKSLMDLIQIECLSQSSGVLRITRGSLEGRVWIDGGNVIDAEAAGPARRRGVQANFWLEDRQF